MTLVFILDGETVLCRRTSKGWWPLTVQSADVEAGTKKNTSQQHYQIGNVALSASPLSTQKPSSEQMHTLSPTDTNGTTNQPSGAISYEYALAHNVTLPLITVEGDTSFVAYRQLIAQLPMTLSNQLSEAIQLLRWQLDTQFCSRCGGPVEHAKHNERAMVCPVCKLRQYPRVQPCVITAITRPNPQTGETQLLLAHHHRYGQQELPLQYGLIAGFVEVGESLEQAVSREVSEEVGIEVSDICYVSSQPWPFPSNLMLGFQATYVSGEILIQKSELSHADFFDVTKLPKIPLKGSIAHELITQIVHQQGRSL